jgi:hypothetical protein
MRRAGWDTNEIRAFQAEAAKGNYDHLFITMLSYCEDVSEEEEEWNPYAEDEEE